MLEPPDSPNNDSLSVSVDGENLLSLLQEPKPLASAPARPAPVQGNDAAPPSFNQPSFNQPSSFAQSPMTLHSKATNGESLAALLRSAAMRHSSHRPLFTAVPESSLLETSENQATNGNSFTNMDDHSVEEMIATGIADSAGEGSAIEETQREESQHADEFEDEVNPAASAFRRVPSHRSGLPQDVSDFEQQAAFGLASYQNPPPNHRPLYLILGGVAVVLAGVAVFYFRGSFHSAVSSVAQASGTVVVSPGASASPLQLKVESRDHSLIGIRWDAQSAPVLNAREGRLIILESDQQSRIVPLQLAQLKIGHLYYETPADRVEFRLEVVDQNGAITQESFMALAPAGATTANAVANNALPVPIQGQLPGQVQVPGQTQALSQPNTANGSSPISQPTTAAASPAVSTDIPTQPANDTPARPVARQFTPPPSTRSADAPRAIYLEPPTESVAAPSLPIVAGLTEAINHVTPPPAVPAAPRPISVPSNLQAANIVKRVAPIYPIAAKTSRIQGMVRFSANIGKDGTIRNLKVLAGNSLLIQAATDAVKQWVYRPTLLNGQPVEVITQIEVNFTLN